MSDEPAKTGPDAELLARSADSIAASCGEDLSALLGRAVELRPGGVEKIDAEAVTEQDDPLVDQLCRTTDEPGADIHLLMPRDDALRAASLQLGGDGEDIADRQIDGEVRAAFQVVMKLVASNLSGSFEDAGLASIEARDAREVAEPASDPTWLVGEHFLRLRFEFVVEKLPDGRLDVLVGDPGEGAGADDHGRSICFVSDGEAEHGSLEEIGAVLEWPVSVLEPQRLQEVWEEAVVNAGAVVVPWEVGGRAGLDFVTMLTRDEKTADVPILMSSEAPTRAMVRAALGAGARGFVMRPYDGEELRRRIREARGEPCEGAPAPAEDSVADGEGAADGAA